MVLDRRYFDTAKNAALSCVFGQLPPFLSMSSDAPPPASSASPDNLIQRCLSGDQRAWEEIVRMHWRKVFNVAYKFVGKHEEAEDLTQDIFLKIFKSLDTFDRRANFQTWLISVSRNLCIDHYRSVRKERETIDRDIDANELSPVSVEVSPHAALEQRDRVTLLREAMQTLAPSLRTAVLMRDIQEMSYQEIADKLHLPEGTVKSRINRGRTELARQIKRLRDRQERHAALGRPPASVKRPRRGSRRPDV
jgi:RNA polymerase sigma factor (sigma-70 family)